MQYTNPTVFQRRGGEVISVQTKGAPASRFAVIDGGKRRPSGRWRTHAADAVESVVMVLAEAVWYCVVYMGVLAAHVLIAGDVDPFSFAALAPTVLLALAGDVLLEDAIFAAGAAARAFVERALWALRGFMVDRRFARVKRHDAQSICIMRRKRDE